MELLDKLQYSDTEYRKIKRESFSSLKYLLKSPFAFKEQKEKPFKGNLAALLGTCTHHIFQGNENLIAYNPYRNVKGNQEKIDKLTKEHMEKVGGEGVIAPESFREKLESFKKILDSKPKIRSLLEDCIYEDAFLFEFNGVELKGKVDCINHNKKKIIEIKTTSGEISKDSFKETVTSLSYDMQAALYRSAYGEDYSHYFVAIRTLQPFDVVIFKTSKETLQKGLDKAKIATERYKKYILNNEIWEEDEDIEEI